MKDGQETEVAETAKAKLADVLDGVSNTQVPQSIAIERKYLANLLCASEAMVEDIRSAVDKCNAKKPVGLYKIFAAWQAKACPSSL